MKKALSLIVSMAIACPAAAFTVSAQQTSAITAIKIVEHGTYELEDGSTMQYTIDEFDNVSVGGYKGSGGDVVLPTEINGKAVKKISGFAFYGCEDMTSVTFPETVESIAYSAFTGCSGLTSVKIPDGVKEISHSMYAKIKLSQSGQK